MSQRGRNDTKLLPKAKPFGGPSKASIVASPTRVGTQTNFKLRSGSGENDPRINVVASTTRQPGTKFNTESSSLYAYGTTRTQQSLGPFGFPKSNNKSPKTKPTVSSPSVMDVELSASKTLNNRNNQVRASAVFTPELNCAYETEISQFLYGNQVSACCLLLLSGFLFTIRRLLTFGFLEVKSNHQLE